VSRPVWGVIRANVCFHVSPGCKKLKSEGLRANPPTEYMNELAAYDAGHLRPCPSCAGGIYVDDASLTADQLETLRAIHSIQESQCSSMTISQVAKHRGKNITTCHAIINKLVKKGLVKKDYNKFLNKAKNKTIRITPFGAQIIRSVS